MVELLVVVGIITILIAILMPSLRKARDAAERTACLAKMRQLGQALMMYTGEWKQMLPRQVNAAVSHFADPAVYDAPGDGGRTALAALLPYLGHDRRVFTCPTAAPVSFEAWAPTALSDTNYMGNHAVFDRRLTRVRGSSEIVFLQEERFRWHLAWLRPSRAHPGTVNGRRVYTAWCFDNGDWGQEYSNVYSGGGNLLFVDGHGDWWPNKQLRAKHFGLVGGEGVRGNADDENSVPHLQTYFLRFDD